MANTIRFCHHYDKLRNINMKMPVRLLIVLPVNYEELPTVFMNYDTSYHIRNRQYKYELPKGKLLFLLFMDTNGNVFTTLRQYSIEKYKFYNQNIGFYFQIEIKDRKAPGDNSENDAIELDFNE